MYRASFQLRIPTPPRLMILREFTSKELRLYDGKNGFRAYIAFEGKVYDVTGSYFWRAGKHWVRHLAGTDLTGQIDQAPHDAQLLDRFPVVGIYIHNI